MKKIKLYSLAKINLTLEIIKKLPSGFHSLRSIMVKTENLQDEIEMIFDEEKDGIKIVCDDKSIPTDEKNICWQIAEKFFSISKKRIGLTIKIKKKIPALAGLGGGSSNGATVLLALNDHFGKPLNFKKLIKLADEVGKDIPVFLIPDKAVFVSGAGEKLKPLKNFPKLNLLLINPKGEIATGWAYGELDRRMWFMTDKRRKNLSAIILKNTQNIERLSGLMHNDFSLVTEELFPVIREIKGCLSVFGCLGASITGKGPTVVGIFKTKKETLQMKAMLKKKYPDFFVELG